jgi:hypothetical protein
MLPPLELPVHYNYIGVFLTFACNMRCDYCINRFGELASGGRLLSGAEWVAGLNRLVPSTDLPISLQGGEPTLHPEFAAIVNGIRPELHIDLLTNLETDIDLFMQKIPSSRMRRDAPYASIRVSFHPDTMQIEPLADKVLRLLQAGYSIGIWGVLHPEQKGEIQRAQEYCLSRGIDFRTKEFLGVHDGVLHGIYRYPGSCSGAMPGKALCRTTELLIGPDGSVFRCHSDLYAGRGAIGHILDPDLVISSEFRPCDHFGFCNPCDVKVKTNRFQEFGHTSVEILLP